MIFHPKTCWATAALALAACSPALNWREVRPPSSDLVAMFPCKPERFARTLILAGIPVQMRMETCSAAGVTYAVTYAQVAEPAQLVPAFEQLRAAALDNVAGHAEHLAPFVVAGMTPNAAAGRWTMQGHGADGKPLTAWVGLFSKGLTVYQATVVGPQVDTEAADTFFTALSLAP